MDILRDLRRRSLQLDNGDVERFRSTTMRRGSMAVDSVSADKKAHSSGGGLLHRFGNNRKQIWNKLKYSPKKVK
jgi:hypothetical protein